MAVNDKNSHRLFDSLKIQSIQVTPGSSGSSDLRIPPVVEVNALNISFCDCQYNAYHKNWCTTYIHRGEKGGFESVIIRRHVLDTQQTVDEQGLESSQELPFVILNMLVTVIPQFKITTN
jgi:hypothetical protein